jgi:hypothetical protein
VIFASSSLSRLSSVDLLAQIFLYFGGKPFSSPVINARDSDRISKCDGGELDSVILIEGYVILCFFYFNGYCK